jgi:hypothetical protein
MQDSNPRPMGKSTLPDGSGDLLECRMAMLGLDAIESVETLNEIRRCCQSCGYREACTVDLKRDPNNPVWETYCPRAGTLIALAREEWFAK